MSTSDSLSEAEDEANYTSQSFEDWLMEIKEYPEPDEDIARMWLSQHKTCMMHNNYHILINRYMSKFSTYINDDDHSWYYLVFKPFKKTKSLNYQWYMTKGLDYCRKKISNHAIVYLCTLEYESESPHINVLVYGRTDSLDQFLGTMNNGTPKHCNKYAYYGSIAIFGERVLKYVLKEAKVRFFHKYKDYLEMV